MLFTKDINVVKKNYEHVYYLHIPKTSGTSLISDKIDSLGHGFNVDNAYRMPREMGGYHGYRTDTWKQYTYPVKNNLTFSVIRNPYDLLCSYYHHGVALKANNEYCHSGWASANYTHQFHSFEEFIRAYCDESFDWHIPFLQNFLFSQLFDKNNNCVPDLIIKFEYLNEAIIKLNSIGFDIVRAKKRVSKLKTSNYMNYYNAELIKLVAKKCNRELEIFKYNFENTWDDNYFICPNNLKYSVNDDIASIVIS